MSSTSQAPSAASRQPQGPAGGGAKAARASRVARGSGKASDGYFTHHGMWAPGVRMFRHLQFRAKSLIVGASLLVPLLVLLVWQLVQQNDATLQARLDSTRQHVEIAHGILQWAHDQEKSGMDRAHAQKLAMGAIGQLRYDGNEYFWVNDMGPKMLMHPIKPELVGKDMSENRDPNGKYLFREFVNVVNKSGKGFVDYQWPKPGNEKPVDKISYVIGMPAWGWIVGSGVYVQDLQEAARHRMIVLAGITASVLLLSMYLFVSFYRVMAGGLSETQRHLQAMAHGDLTTTPRPWGTDEAAHLMRDLVAMQDSMRHIVRGVQDRTHAIHGSSVEISSGATNLAQRTEETAASLQQSSASMEEVSATVKNTAEHTDNALRVARLNSEVAAKSGAAMREVVTTMDSIRGSSSRIGEITSTIDGIAFQTNILALNAAVEAARAGEQGRGFAVVASEVRSLAQRSSAAAREIKELIQSSVEGVDKGTAVVQQAAGTIEGAVSASREVDELLGQVATGAREQTLGIAQINTALHGLDTMTQQNAALVEQTSAASEMLLQQADELRREVARFKLPAA